MASEVRSKALHRAATVVGSRHKLRELLGVPMRDLEAWLADESPTPIHVFLRAVDLLSTAPAHVARASETTASILARPNRVDGKRHPISPLTFMQARFAPDDGPRMVDAALDAAVSASGAAMGTLQLQTAQGLLIVAHNGFEQPFLDYFSCVTHEGACGAAAERAERVVVRDVQADPIFAGTPSADVMAAANARAVQSTPLVSPAGKLVGMLSTHFDRPHEPAARELDAIDHIARRAAYWLDGGAL